MTSYLLCNRSSMCQEIMDTLPDTHHEHFTKLNTEEHYADHPIHSTLHPTVSKTLRNKFDRIQSNPDGDHPPSVLFYDSDSKDYVHHEGTKAIQFLHTYVHSHHTNRMNRHQQHVDTHPPKLHHSHANLKSILNIAVPHESKISDSLRQTITANTKSQLQHLYSTIHKSHIPFNK